MARSRKTPRPNDDPPDTAHAFADTTDRFSVDNLLRKHGFKILARPRKGPALWAKGGQVYSQKRAVGTLPRDLVKGARYLEEGYYDELVGD